MIIVGCEGITPFILRNLPAIGFQKHQIIPAIGEKPEKAVYISSFSRNLVYLEGNQRDFTSRLSGEIILTQYEEPFTKLLQGIFPSPKEVGIGESFKDITNPKLKGRAWETFWVLNVNNHVATLIPCLFTEEKKLFIVPGTDEWPKVEKQKKGYIFSNLIMAHSALWLSYSANKMKEEEILKAMMVIYNPEENKIMVKEDIPLADEFKDLEAEKEDSIFNEIGLEIDNSMIYKVKDEKDPAPKPGTEE